MKKTFILTLILILCETSFSQSLVKFGLTYTIGKEQSHLGRKKDANHETNVNSSFGAGLSVEIGYIYLRKRNYGPEASFSFFIGKPKVVSHITENGTERETIINRKLLFFSPSLFVFSNSTDDLNPYISSGLLINVWEDVRKTEYITNANNQTIEKRWKVNYNRGIGYKSRIGLMHSTADDLLLYAEMQFQMFSISYKSEILEEYIIDGKDEFSTLSLSEKEKIYQLEFNHESNNILSTHFNKEKPENLLLKYANHNHFGINGGAFFLLK